MKQDAFASPFPAQLIDDLGPIPFLEAKHFNRNVRRTVIKLAVLHCTDTPEMGDRAERCARYFHELIPDTRKASAHYCHDSNSTVQMVRDNRIAYGAGGVNPIALHIEHAGLARQTREQWLDPFGLAMLDRSAFLMARHAGMYGFPIRYVDGGGLLRGEAGITTHAAVNWAFRRGNHSDPGKGFPLDLYIARCLEYAAREPTLPTVVA